MTAGCSRFYITGLMSLSGNAKTLGAWLLAGMPVLVFHVKRWFDDWVESEEPNEELRHGLWAEIESDVLYCCKDGEGGEHAAYHAAFNFSSDVVKDFDFTDFFEVSSQVYTFHFLWCCYAIAWGVKTYDESKLAGGEK